MIEESRKVVKTENLSDYFQRPVVVEKRRNFDKLVLGLSTQSQERQDQFLTTEVIKLITFSFSLIPKIYCRFYTNLVVTDIFRI